MTRSSPHPPLSLEGMAALEPNSAHPVGPPSGGEDLVVAAVHGDRRAAERLLTDLVPRVRNLVRYLVRGDDDTDDISQEALVAILRGLGSYRAEGTLQSWADRIVVRATFAFIRKRRSEPASGRATLRDVDGMALTVLPDEYLTRRRAVAVLDELPQEQRHALVLHHVLEMSVPEIAVQLSVPAETVRSRLRLGRSRLREKEITVAAALRGHGVHGKGQGKGEEDE